MSGRKKHGKALANKPVTAAQRQHATPSNDADDAPLKRGFFGAQMKAYKGPIPSPELLREFEEIVPGYAEKLVQPILASQLCLRV